MKTIIINNLIVLEPNENTHLKHIKTGDVFEGNVYLGVFDKAENYVEVSEESYKEWLLKRKHQEQK